MELRGSGEGGFSLIATPEDPTHPRLRIAYATAADAAKGDPSKDLRAEGGWEPERLGARPSASWTRAQQLAIDKLRTMCTAQSLFRDGDKDRNSVLDYAARVAALSKAGLQQFDLVSTPDGGSVGRAEGYAFRILGASEHAWAAVAYPYEGSPLEMAPGLASVSFFMDESGIIRWARGRMADATCEPITR